MALGQRHHPIPTLDNFTTGVIPLRLEHLTTIANVLIMISTTDTLISACVAPLF